MAHIIQPDNTRQIAGTLDYNPVIEHFYLNIGSLDAIVTMGRGVDDNFFPYEFWVFRRCYEFAFFSEISMFLNLVTDKRQCFSIMSRMRPVKVLSFTTFISAPTFASMPS